MAEARQGFELWRSIDSVVSLTVDIRAPGLLTRLQAEMRAGHISDEMWEACMSRVLQPHDERLLQAPFNQGETQYILHRHSIRVRHSHRNVIEACRRLSRRLYIVQAAYSVKRDDEPRFTASKRRELMRRANPRHTGGLATFLSLYIGMRLVLNAKDCVRFGLMKGAECILEHIVFADQEILPEEVVAGEPIYLKYMPASLIVRLVNAPWKLEGSVLPKLPATMYKRGLVQLVPEPKYVTMTEGNKKTNPLEVKLIQFSVMPGDARIVHGAQGETFDAVIADMQKPPRMDPDDFWLACYVMLSRSTSLEGFLILRPASRAASSRKLPQYLIDEIDRLLALEKSSTARLKSYIRSLECSLPPEILRLFNEDAEAEELRTVNLKRGLTAAHTTHGITVPRGRKRLFGKQPDSELIEGASEKVRVVALGESKLEGAPFPGRRGMRLRGKQAPPAPSEPAALNVLGAAAACAVAATATIVYNASD